MVDGQHQEGPAPIALGHHGDEAGVDGAVVVVMDTAGDGDVMVTMVPGDGLTLDLSQPGEEHLEGKNHRDEEIYGKRECMSVILCVCVCACVRVYVCVCTCMHVCVCECT